MFKKLRQSGEDWVTHQKKSISERNTFKKLTMCKKCYTFYYKNSWHFERPSYLEEGREEDVAVHFTECPSCLEQSLAFYESESSMVLGGI